jgi:2-polyprenyl-3-methyl-5-hydroxy-6-metoxy-1,4-benzoquinol methylase
MDVGCGHGELLDFLSPQVERVILVDRSPERRPRVEQRQATAGIPVAFEQFDIDQTPWNRGFEMVDTLVMAAILEHLKRPSDVLLQLREVVKPNGCLVLTTPTPLGGRLHRVASHFHLTYAEAADEHEHFYNHLRLLNLLWSCGFVVERYERFLMGFNQLVVAKPIERETTCRD